MLIGQYDGKLGEKARVGFPKKFREVLGDKLIITHGFEGSLLIVPETGWKQLLEGTENIPFTSSSARETQRFLLGGATFIELDEKGRFILPEYLRKFSQIHAEVIFLGISKYVEMWDKEHWNEYQKKLTRNISMIAEKLSGQGNNDE
ncbi:division/cell wall cluster transcriptional repressor MraZ [soil metagenome]